MRTGRTLTWGLALVLAWAFAANAGKVKTGAESGNVFTDARYEFTFEKSENWKFKIFDEDPKRPAGYRFRLQKAVYQVPAERQFARDTWTPACGGVFIDTTSMDLEQFKTMLATPDRKNKLRETIGRQAEIIRDGLVGDIKRTDALKKLGPAYQLTFKQEYSAQIKDVRGNYNIITDHLMGDMYVTINAGKAYVFFFTAERAEYRLAREEFERMLASLSFPGKEKSAAPGSGTDSTAQKAPQP